MQYLLELVQALKYENRQDVQKKAQITQLPSQGGDSRQLLDGDM